MLAKHKEEEEEGIKQSGCKECKQEGKNLKIGKKWRKSNFGGKFMAFPNESKKLSNVDANVSVLKILVAPTRN